MRYVTVKLEKDDVLSFVGPFLVKYCCFSTDWKETCLSV